MDKIGLSSEEKADLYRVTAAVLHLGNIAFEENHKDKKGTDITLTMFNRVQFAPCAHEVHMYMYSIQLHNGTLYQPSYMYIINYTYNIHVDMCWLQVGTSLL